MQSTDEMLAAATAAHQAGHEEDAEARYLALLAREPEHDRALHNLGSLYRDQGRLPQALQYLEQALAAAPEHGQYWLSYIDCLHHAGQADTAREVMTVARSYGLDGDEADALQQRLSAAPHAAAGYCPVCGDQQAVFAPLPDFYREQSRIHGFQYFGQGEMISLDKYSCQRCMASDRERIYALWLDGELEQGRLSSSSKVLHFAPEPALSSKLRKQFPDYTTADFAMAGVDHKVDLQALPFADESYDLFLCSHVLEHVPSDDKAIQELYRITRKGGCGILVAPVIVGLEATVEDPAVNDAEGRWRLYGQDDHLRLYAHDDYVHKIRSHGFHLEELGEGHFGKAVFQSLGLTSTSILYVVRK